MEVTAGSSSISGKVITKWTTADVDPTVVPKMTMEGSFKPRLVENGSKSSRFGESSLGVGFKASSERCSFLSNSSRANTVFRCAPARVESSSGGLSGIRSADFREETPHRSSRAFGSLLYSRHFVRNCQGQ